MGCWFRCACSNGFIKLLDDTGSEHTVTCSCWAWTNKVSFNLWAMLFGTTMISLPLCLAWGGLTPVSAPSWADRLFAKRWDTGITNSSVHRSHTRGRDREITCSSHLPSWMNEMGFKCDMQTSCWLCHSRGSGNYLISVVTGLESDNQWDKLNLQHV